MANVWGLTWVQFLPLYAYAMHGYQSFSRKGIPSDDSARGNGDAACRSCDECMGISSSAGDEGEDYSSPRGGECADAESGTGVGRDACICVLPERLDGCVGLYDATADGRSGGEQVPVASRRGDVGWRRTAQQGLDRGCGEYGRRRVESGHGPASCWSVGRVLWSARGGRRSGVERDHGNVYGRDAVGRTGAGVDIGASERGRGAGRVDCGGILGGGDGAQLAERAGGGGDDRRQRR